MDRKTIKTKKDNQDISLYDGLIISLSKKPILESYLTNLMGKYKSIHKVIEHVWNDSQNNNKDVIMCLIGIGRAQAQHEMIEQQKNIISSILKRVKTESMK